MKKRPKFSYAVSVVVVIAAVLITFFLTNQFHINKFKEYKVGVQEQLDKNTAKVSLLQTQRDTLKSQIANLTAEKDSNLDFLKDYSTSLINIHRAMSYIDLASANLASGNEYVATGEYYYNFAIPFYDVGKEQVLDAKELLNKAKIRLKSVESKSPNDFYKKDVENRIKQVDALLSVSDSLYDLLDYQGKQLYEVNYGSESKATDFLNRYNNLIPKYNSQLEQLGKVHDSIDLEWDQDWYASFQG
jgi:vacuolar-type H+-ATPase subunit I/STV1